MLTKRATWPAQPLAPWTASLRRETNVVPRATMPRHLPLTSGLPVPNVSADFGYMGMLLDPVSSSRSAWSTAVGWPS
jgi:hypothetical protein